jgi:hypothetical protein
VASKAISRVQVTSTLVFITRRFNDCQQIYYEFEK